MVISDEMKRYCSGQQHVSSASAGVRIQNNLHLSADVSLEICGVFLWQPTASEAHHLHPEDAEQTVQFPGDRAELRTVQQRYYFTFRSLRAVGKRDVD